MGDKESTAKAEKALVVPAPEKERRLGNRVKMTKPMLARPTDPKYKEEVVTTLNVSRYGLYFETRAEHYYLGMHLSVIFPYAPEDPVNAPVLGVVVRVDKLTEGNRGVAVRLAMRL
jgi:PilZ domain